MSDGPCQYGFKWASDHWPWYYECNTWWDAWGDELIRFSVVIVTVSILGFMIGRYLGRRTT